MITSMNLTFNITIENIELEVTGEYYHAPNELVGEYQGVELKTDKSEFEIKSIIYRIEVQLKPKVIYTNYPLDIINLLPLFEDKIYPICFDKARELYLDRLSKNE